MLINVDCDGVLVPNWYEELFMKKLQEFPQGISKGSPIFDWYFSVIHEHPLLPLNVPLLRALANSGHSIRLWTNRNDELVKRTLQNLGPWVSIFDSFHFLNGDKIRSRVDGIVIDNSINYLKCGELGAIHYQWR